MEQESKDLWSTLIGARIVEYKSIKYKPAWKKSGYDGVWCTEEFLWWFIASDNFCCWNIDKPPYINRYRGTLGFLVQNMLRVEQYYVSMAKDLMFGGNEKNFPNFSDQYLYHWPALRAVVMIELVAGDASNNPPVRMEVTVGYDHSFAEEGVSPYIVTYEMSKVQRFKDTLNAGFSDEEMTELMKLYN